MLDQLTREKLEVLAEKVRGEGWKWVEINPHVDYSDLTKFKRIYPVHAASRELRSQIEALEEEQEKINETYQDADKYPPDVDKRMAEIEERIEELNEQTQQYREEEKKLAGAVVSIDSIHRGLVRPEDKRKAEAAKLGGDTGNPTGEGEEPKEEVELSAALVEDLTANRTAALRGGAGARPGALRVRRQAASGCTRRPSPLPRLRQGVLSRLPPGRLPALRGWHEGRGWRVE